MIKALHIGDAGLFYCSVFLVVYYPIFITFNLFYITGNRFI